MEENPFPDLKIDSSDFLDSLSGRSKCSQCEKSRKYYCYTCYVPVPEIKGKVPKIKLPVKVDVIKHPSEVDGKSTAVHAAVIAPDDVAVYTYPCIPDYDKDKVVLVFPGETSITLTELAKKWDLTSSGSAGKRKSLDSDVDDSQNCSGNKIPRLENEEKENGGSDITCLDGKSVQDDKPRNVEDESEADSLQSNSLSKQMVEDQVSDHGKNNAATINDELRTKEAEPVNAENLHRLDPTCKLERVVFVDSTWNQTKTICSDERLRGLQCIELKTRETKFWRHQKDIPNTYLSTVEAIYYFLREYHEQFIQCDYSGQYDNLLFFFSYMYQKIRTLYGGGSELKAYKKRTGK